MQTRLPKELADELDAAVGEHQADLLLGQEAEGEAIHALAIPGLATFPAADLQETMDAAMKVLACLTIMQLQSSLSREDLIDSWSLRSL